MGASNFYNKNANRVYAVGMSEEVKYSKCSECDEKIYEYEEGYVPEGTTTCPECGAEESVKHDTEYRSLESYEWDDLKSYITDTLAEVDGYQDGGSDDNDRSYYGKSMGFLTASKSFGDTEVEVRVQAMLRSGYYEGANLDYQEPEMFVSGYDSDSESLSLDFNYYSDMNGGLKKIQAKNASKWAEKAKQELADKLEEVFTKIAMPLTVVARFPNGETMYEKA